MLTTPFSLKASIPQRPVIDTPAKYTNVASLRVTGRTSPGSHLEFWIDGRIANLADPIDANGEGYYAGNVPLGDTDGRHYIKAIAYDDYGNRSSYSGSISTTLDTVAPVISLTRPALTADGSALGTNLDRIAIQGSTEGRSTVILTLTAPDGTVIKEVVKFLYPLEHVQYDQAINSLFGLGTGSVVTDATLSVRVSLWQSPVENPTHGLIVYCSRIDNVTNDPVYLEQSFAKELPWDCVFNGNCAAVTSLFAPTGTAYRRPLAPPAW